MYKAFLEESNGDFVYLTEFKYLEHAEVNLAKVITSKIDLINWGIIEVENDETVIGHHVDVSYLEYLWDEKDNN